MMHGPDEHDYRNNRNTQVKWVSEFEDPKVAKAVRHIAELGME